jgi:hypothetical protein
MIIAIDDWKFRMRNTARLVYFFSWESMLKHQENMMFPPKLILLTDQSEASLPLEQRTITHLVLL